jgi:ribosome-associated toxin RatA of RatAB toxin-antitoxin module
MECSVVVHALLSGADTQQTFDRLADFAAYPEFTDAIRTVQVTHIDSTTLESTWEVNFRKGILIWTERDTIDPATRRIDFVQTKGDFSVFTGSWLVVEEGDTVRVEFASRFDLGIASLASLIDPVACTALRDAISEILRGLFGTDIEVETIEAAPIDV